MEQKFTVEEIVKDTKLRNTEKTKLLYLQHNKDYNEIAELLNIKETTVRYNVSAGGYCKQQKGKHFREYGDIRAEINRIHNDNPDVTAVEIASEIGCGVSIIRRYARELGIKFKNSRNHHPKGIPHKKRSARKAAPEKVEIPQKEIVEEQIEENTPPLEVVNSEKPYEILEYPYVEYNGHIYEILSRHELRRYLYKDLKIIRHKRKPPVRTKAQ